MSHLILVINPGSTSTKLAIFEEDRLIVEKTLRHESKELEPFARMADQYAFRNQMILDFLKEAGYRVPQFSAVIGRGGLVRPIAGGTYRVNEGMLEDLRTGRYGEHASNLGAILAAELVGDLPIPTLIADPVVVDERIPVACYSGYPSIQRKAIFHALNQKAVARAVAKTLGKTYDRCNLIVAHMGGGISIGAHQNGKVIDVNNALDGDGPFSPERSGTLPLTQLIDLCFRGDISLTEMRKKIKGKGGLVAYLGTTDARAVQQRIRDGDAYAKEVYHAMAYQIGKWIGKMAAVLKGKVDQTVLTGGLAYDQAFLVPWISEMVEYIAPITVIPGGDEERALAESALRVLLRQEEAKVYDPKG